MRKSYLLVSLLILVSCGKSSKPDNANSIQETGSSNLPLSSKFVAYSKAKPDSLVECQATAKGDTHCRLASESKIIILDAHPDGEQRTYKVEYENSCKRLNVHPEAMFASGIVLKAQPENEGDIHGEIYLNKSDALTIRGKGDLRLEEPSREMLSQTLEKGCALTLRFTIVGS